MKLESFLFVQVATWLDETLSAVASKLEHSAKMFPDFEKEKIHEIFTCPLYTCVQTVPGNLYWWYVNNDYLYRD